MTETDWAFLGELGAILKDRATDTPERTYWRLREYGAKPATAESLARLGPAPAVSHIPKDTQP